MEEIYKYACEALIRENKKLREELFNYKEKYNKLNKFTEKMAEKINGGN